MYTWYKHMQESAITFGIPLMPFRGIVLRQKAYVVCLPGMGTHFWTICGRLLMKVLRQCVPDDSSEGSDNIREMMGCQENGFDSLWYILEVAAQMIDEHRVPVRPVYKGTLAKHTGAWDVYIMMLNHRGSNFKPENASTEFLRSITCPRFSLAAKVELGMLLRDIAQKVSPWTMPTNYEVRIMAARILAASPQVAATMEDLNRPPVVWRFQQEDTAQAQWARDRSVLRDRVRHDCEVALEDAEACGERERARAEDASVGWDTMERTWDMEERLQGYCLRVNATDADYGRTFRGPS